MTVSYLLDVCECGTVNKNNNSSSSKDNNTGSLTKGEETMTHLVLSHAVIMFYHTVFVVLVLVVIKVSYTLTEDTSLANHFGKISNFSPFFVTNYRFSVGSA